MKRAKVLLIVEECNPEGMSSPRIGFEFFRALSERTEVTLVTRERFRPHLQRAEIQSPIDYIPMGQATSAYFSFLTRHLYPRLTNWGIRHALSYPIYSQFNREVFRRYHKRVASGEFDIVHAITPMIPRYPYKIATACEKTPFFLGPVNGGLPCPKQFQNEMRSEFAFSGLLRSLSQSLPGYKETYSKATKVFVGSAETERILCNNFPFLPDKCERLAENGISETILQTKPACSGKESCQLVWTGRLTPVKGLDLLFESLQHVQGNWHLSIVGEGPERERLTTLANQLNISPNITFTGWVSSEATSAYYRSSDLFCFPSIRESGGAAVLEAMAHGLPIVAFDYGGYTEYLDSECGQLIPLSDPNSMKQRLAKEIERLIASPDLRKTMGASALTRASKFTWQAKADTVIDAYGFPVAKLARNDTSVISG